MAERPTRRRSSDAESDHGHDHRFQCVSLVPVFATLSEEDRHRVAAIARTRRYDRNEMIYVPGDRSGLHIVHRGQVKTYRVTESGAEQLIRIVGPGDFLGETALLTSLGASDSAVAIQPSYVCSIGRAEVRQLMQRNPDVAIDVLEAVAARLHLAEEQLSSLSGLSVGERLAKHLLEESAAAGATTFRLASTKKDLAAYLGTTAETLSRRLAALQDRGLVRVGSGRTIEILDPTGLRGYGG